MPMGPPFKAHLGFHTPTSNTVQGEETSQGNGVKVEIPTLNLMMPPTRSAPTE
jgi:hypothetical protein